MANAHPAIPQYGIPHNAAYAAWPNPGNPIPPSPNTQYQQYGQRSGGHKKKKQARTGRNPGFTSQPPAAAPPPPAPAQGGAIPPPAGGGSRPAGSGAKNAIKYYNNWSMCYSCGFDVPAWHNSTTCPAVCRKPHHQLGCTRENAEGYIAAGHFVCKKGRHKSQLPINPPLTGPDRWGQQKK
jgi:hypothetical protein